MRDNTRMPLHTRLTLRNPAVVFALLYLLFCYCGTQTTAGADTPLTLQEAVRPARTHHPTIRIGEATIAAAQQRVRQQEAGYLPRGGYTYAFTRQQRPVSA